MTRLLHDVDWPAWFGASGTVGAFCVLIVQVTGGPDVPHRQRLATQ